MRSPDDLTDEAWVRIDEALTSGTMTLDNGTVVKLNPIDMVRLVQWLASRKGKQREFVAAPDDFVLQETKVKKDGKEKPQESPKEPQSPQAGSNPLA